MACKSPTCLHTSRLVLFCLTILATIATILVFNNAFPLDDTASEIAEWIATGATSALGLSSFVLHAFCMHSDSKRITERRKDGKEGETKGRRGERYFSNVVGIIGLLCIATALALLICVGRDPALGTIVGAAGACMITISFVLQVRGIYAMRKQSGNYDQKLDSEIDEDALTSRFTSIGRYKVNDIDTQPDRESWRTNNNVEDLKREIAEKTKEVAALEEEKNKFESVIQDNNFLKLKRSPEWHEAWSNWSDADTELVRLKEELSEIQGRRKLMSSCSRVQQRLRHLL